MAKTVVMTMVVLALAACAQAQETPDPALRSAFTGQVLRLPPAPEPIRNQTAKAQVEDEDAEDPNSGWNGVKRGFYSGLVAGAVLGIVLVAECGHPECGPLLTLAAGAGAGIGAAIDAMVDQHKPAQAVAMRRDARDAPFARGRRIAVSLRTSW